MTFKEVLLPSPNKDSGHSHCPLAQVTLAAFWHASTPIKNSVIRPNTANKTRVETAQLPSPVEDSQCSHEGEMKDGEFYVQFPSSVEDLQCSHIDAEFRKRQAYQLPSPVGDSQCSHPYYYAAANAIDWFPSPVEDSQCSHLWWHDWQKRNE